MATIEELRAQAAAAAANTQGQTQPPVSSEPVSTNSAQIQQDTTTAVEEAQPVSLARTFKHPVAGSTSIMPNGKVLVFAGPMMNSQDRRYVGEGLIETEDAAEISWLEQQARMRTTQISEVTLTSSGAVVGGNKPTDPAISQATQDAMANTQRATTESVANLQDNFGKIIKETQS